MSTIGREEQPGDSVLRSHVRHGLKRIPGVTNCVHFARAVSELLRDPWASAESFDQEFSKHWDPWKFSSPVEQERLSNALSMLDTAGGRFARAWEIGCAEGAFTQRLRPRCGSLLAVDISAVALERAQRRCNWDKDVSFRRWDLRKDAVPTGFDLVVAMCVLEYLRRPADFSRAREKIVSALNPGGYLLVSHARQSQWQENSWWGRWLLRDGKWINAFLAQHQTLVPLSTHIGSRYINALFRRKAA